MTTIKETVVKILALGAPTYRLDGGDFAGYSTALVHDTTPVPVYVEGKIVGKATEMRKVTGWGQECLLYTATLQISEETLNLLIREPDGSFVAGLEGAAGPRGIYPTRIKLKVREAGDSR